MIFAGSPNLNVMYACWRYKSAVCFAVIVSSHGIMAPTNALKMSSCRGSVNLSISVCSFTFLKSTQNRGFPFCHTMTTGDATGDSASDGWTTPSLYNLSIASQINFLFHGLERYAVCDLIFLQSARIFIFAICMRPSFPLGSEKTCFLFRRSSRIA